MRVRILVLENGRCFPSVMCSKLREFGFEVTVASYMQYCSDRELYAHYTLIIYITAEQERLDELERFNRPVLYVLTQDDLPRKIGSFRMGIEDYIADPINFTELILRIQMLLRCAGIPMERKLRLAHLEMDLDARAAMIDGIAISLTAREFNILYGMLSCPDRTFTRQELMREYWGEDTKTSKRAVDVYMTKLRDKFSDCHDFRIETVHGVGYKAVLQ